MRKYCRGVLNYVYVDAKHFKRNLYIFDIIMYRV